MADRELELVGAPFGPRLLLRRAGREPVLPDVAVVSLSATLLVADELVASTGIDTMNGDGLDDWWHDLANSFRGWEGKKTWESLEHDAKLSARHDGTGHVTVRVTLRGRLGYQPDWEASAMFALDAGEALTRVAAEVSEFMRDRNARMCRSVVGTNTRRRSCPWRQPGRARVFADMLSI